MRCLHLYFSWMPRGHNLSHFLTALNVSLSFIHLPNNHQTYIISYIHSFHTSLYAVNRDDDALVMLVPFSFQYKHIWWRNRRVKCDYFPNIFIFIRVYSTFGTWATRNKITIYFQWNFLFELFEGQILQHFVKLWIYIFMPFFFL